MNRLPTEVFQYLLTVISKEIRSGAEPWEVYIPLAQLRLVSSSWMVAIDSHPPLWTLLTNRHGERLFSLALERSGTLPLHIDLCCSADNSTMQHINAVAKLAPRWLSLHISWVAGRSARCEDAVESLLLTPAPQLRTVSFDRLNKIASSLHLFGGAASELETIIMNQSVPNWESLLTWDLKHLAIRWLGGAREKDLEALIQVLGASLPWKNSNSLAGRGRYQPAVFPQIEELFPWIASIP
ncbi:hypothetical protein FRC01_010238 [Tulasnella sp. 417]|nr:hypothetical protein FRC01_010238 [Tulasnella sp. 417]